MNDIERLAAAIRKSRQSSPETEDKRPKEKIDADMAFVDSSLSVATPDAVTEDTEAASSNVLLNDQANSRGIDFAETPALADAASSASAQGDHGCDASPSSTVDHKQHIDIPIEKLTADGFITPLTGRNLLTEQYRRIKRPLLKNIHDSGSSGLNNNVIMVTSSVSGEGKTFTAINLAMSLALEMECTVLLIDADVLKNSASGVLEVGRDKKGLTDVLAGDVQDPADVILKTNISNFTYLPSGASRQHANELLSSTRMKNLFKELSSRYHDRIIVLDCPPILQTNEATVITDYAGQVVFVVAEEDTSQSFVTEALKQIPAENYVGIILNKSRRRVLGNDYGYTYEYG